MKLPRLVLPLILLAATHTCSAAQVRWDGGGGDDQWSTPTNWSGNALPNSTDDVIFDNTFLTGDYIVTLPAGNVAVSIRSLTIIPATGHAIEVVLPSANTANLAFIVNKQGSGLIIFEGGIFRNASGVGGGETLQISDSLIIYNGGKYIHQNRGAHANNIVQALAKRPGTESGIFEFNVPTSSAYALSLSARTYGQLVLSSDANSNIVTYTAISVHPIIINGDLKIGAQVRLSLNASDTLHVKGNLIHTGILINLSSSTRALTVDLKGNWIQSDMATITETGSAGAEITLMGQIQQIIRCEGIISQNIAVKLNNAAGAVLEDTISLPYKLSLSSGRLTTSAANLLLLQPGCSIVADSLSSNSFINGPVRKEGLSSASQFLFPVGKGNALRWLSLTQATGNYTVEFFRDNPRSMCNNYEAGIHHISSIECWSVEADAAPVPQARIKLSFNDPNSGGVTDLAALRVVQLSGSMWANKGNTLISGTAGSNGFVTSQSLAVFNPATRYFALASSSESLNPLYLKATHFTNTGNTTSSPALLAPSVTTGYTKLLFTSGRKSKVQVSITDMSGRTIQTWTAYLRAGINIIPVNAVPFKPGIYIISISGEQGIVQVVRFTKL
jgi:hypothetical protein